MGQAPSRSWRHSSMSILTMDVSVAYPYTSYLYQQRKKLRWYFRKTSFLTRKLKNWPWDMQNSVNFDPLSKWNSHGFLKILTYFTWKASTQVILRITSKKLNQYVKDIQQMPEDKKAYELWESFVYYQNSYCIITTMVAETHGSEWTFQAGFWG